MKIVSYVHSPLDGTFEGECYQEVEQTFHVHLDIWPLDHDKRVTRELGSALFETLCSGLHMEDKGRIGRCEDDDGRRYGYRLEVTLLDETTERGAEGDWNVSEAVGDEDEPCGPGRSSTAQAAGKASSGAPAATAVAEPPVEFTASDVADTMRREAEMRQLTEDWQTGVGR